MSYRGRPSKGCESCRARKVKCDESKPICNRCCKIGHNCTYRNQDDLLFRNQTAFAAQKAEESWRKRSRSHQRADSENSANHQLLPSTGTSPQDTRLTPLSDGSQSPPPTHPPTFDAPALVPNINELSIAPGVNHNLRRLAYERFIYDFVVFGTPNRAPEEPPDALWDFIPHLYNGAAEGSCLATIFHAVSYANFANRCNAPRVLILAQECLGKGIKLLQRTIADKKSASSDETLCAVYLMGVYENLTMPAQDGGYLAHSGGANALLLLRSVEDFYENPISASLYEVAFAQMLIGNLQAGQLPTVAIRNIVAAREYLPNFYGTSGIYVIQLIHQEATLHATWKATKTSTPQPSSRHDLQELLQTALDLDAEFQAWESTMPRTWRYQMERNTAEARSTYEVKWRNLILGSRGAPNEIHTYKTLKRCWVWMFYRTSRIFLLRDLLEILNWMFKLPETTPVSSSSNPNSNKPAAANFDNVGLQIHHSFATTHLVNIMEKSCAAVMTTFTVPAHGKSSEDVVGMRGYSLFWCLGVMDSILKAGLVPDISALPSPPSSSGASPDKQYSQPLGPSSTQPPFHQRPAPSPAVFRMPETNRHLLYHNPQTTVPQINEFPSLPPMPAPSTSTGHIWDSTPRHPFDSPTQLPSDAFTITKTPRIDVSARRDWIHNLLYYIATELGIMKALAIPAAESDLDACAARVKELLEQ